MAAPRIELDWEEGLFRGLLSVWKRFGRETPSEGSREGELGEGGGLGLPLLVGVSRKSFIGSLLGGLPPKERGWGRYASLNGCPVEFTTKRSSSPS